MRGERRAQADAGPVRSTRTSSWSAPGGASAGVRARAARQRLSSAAARSTRPAQPPDDRSARALARQPPDPGAARRLGRAGRPRRRSNRSTSRSAAALAASCWTPADAGRAGARLRRRATPSCTGVAGARSAGRRRARASHASARRRAGRRCRRWGPETVTPQHRREASRVRYPLAVVAIADGGVRLAQQAGAPHRGPGLRASQRSRQACSRLDRPHAHRAYERFTAKGPSRCCRSATGFALVWTAPSEAAARLAALTDSAFLRALQEAFRRRGRAASSRCGSEPRYPLALRVAGDPDRRGRACCSATRRRRCIRSRAGLQSRVARRVGARADHSRGQRRPAEIGSACLAAIPSRAPGLIAWRRSRSRTALVSGVLQRHRAVARLRGVRTRHARRAAAGEDAPSSRA